MTIEQARDLLHDLLLWRQAQGGSQIASVTSGEDMVIATFDDGSSAHIAITVHPAPQGGSDDTS